MQQNQRMLFRHAEKRYLKNGKKTTEQVFDDIRSQTAELMHLCIWTALSSGCGIPEEKVKAVAEWADRYSAMYINAQRYQGPEAAKKELKEQTDTFLPHSFILPAAKAPRKNRDWDILTAQRQAGEMVARLYAKAMNKALSFDAQQIDRVLWLATDIYREKAKETDK